MWGRWSATILSIFMMTVMLGSIIAVTMPSSYVRGSDNNDIKKLELSTTDKVDTKKLAKVNLPFIENNGQVHEDVKYYTNTFAGNVFVSDEVITYTFTKASDDNPAQGVAIKEIFLADNNLEPTGLEKSPAVVNYFIGSADKWRSNIPTYDTISLGEPWSSIDVELRAYGNNIEKIFNVQPGGDVDDIKLMTEGVRSLSLNEDGRLMLDTELGTVEMTKPIAYQEIDGDHIGVDVSYSLNKGDDNSYGFALLDDYNPNYALVIDPLLASTFIGGGG